MNLDTLPLQYQPETRPFGGLLEPLRAAVDNAQHDARAALDDMHEDTKGTMAWDSCEDAIEYLDLRCLYDCRASVKDNAWSAEMRMDGYDTWERADLARHVAELQRLLAALTHLIGTTKHLHRREAEELITQSRKQRELIMTVTNHNPNKRRNLRQWMENRMRRLDVAAILERATPRQLKRRTQLDRELYRPTR